ncbi:response regulator transcription factor [Parabacteroides sp. FAFU027]|uniref:response regulator transcription factor n=1 Tax=Parabacteroides sp. FAFU027 TaxID=2922715 RepID=UPI001FAEE0C1|nr:response regulator transcription factor [Parabacteroides sp. FAFU027]
MRNSQIHIILAEPSPIVQTGIVELLAKSGLHIKWYEADSFAEVQRLIKMEAINLVIINPQLVVNLEKSLQNLRSEDENIHWIALVYAMYDTPLMAMFDGSVHLGDSPEAIASLIRHSINEDKPEDSANRQPLSEREIDVLKLLVTGFSNKEIADKLAISTYTVISHRKNITQKTGIKSVSGLTIYAVVKGIITLNSVAE